MLVQLRCTPSDVSANALRVRLNGPAPSLLAAHTVTVPGGEGGDVPGATIELGIIGSSHCITATIGGTMLREEISCTCGGAELGLYDDTAGPDGYQLVVDKRQGELDSQAAGLDADWFVGKFPGHGPHLTALRAHFEVGPAGQAGWAWRSLHFYPDEDVVVDTQSRWVP